MNSIMMRSGSFPLPRTLRLPLDALRKLFPACFAIPLLERFVRDFALDEEFGEFAALCLALERHRPFCSDRWASRRTVSLILCPDNLRPEPAARQDYERDALSCSTLTSAGTRRNPAVAWQISNSGGIAPRWSAKGDAARRR
jgi:hypothetical protein